MARLTLEQVQHVARLAALQLSEQEAHAMREQLASILDYMASLDALDVAAVEPTWYPAQVGSAMRADEVRPSSSREELLAAAPETEHGGFAVPKVRDGDA